MVFISITICFHARLVNFIKKSSLFFEWTQLNRFNTNKILYVEQKNTLLPCEVSINFYSKSWSYLSCLISLSVCQIVIWMYRTFVLSGGFSRPTFLSEKFCLYLGVNFGNVYTVAKLNRHLFAILYWSIWIESKPILWDCSCSITDYSD